MNDLKRNWTNGLLGRASVVILISILVGCTDVEESSQRAEQKRYQSDFSIDWLYRSFGGQSRVSKPKNVIYVLTDDQRYDELGFMNPIIETPNMDRMAAEGVHFKNAFVTTALCSPSRASILTGQYMHNHGVVDNNKPPRDGTIFSPSTCRRPDTTPPLSVSGTWVNWRQPDASSMIHSQDLIIGLALLARATTIQSNPMASRACSISMVMQ